MELIILYMCIYQRRTEAKGWPIPKPGISPSNSINSPRFPDFLGSLMCEPRIFTTFYPPLYTT